MKIKNNKNKANYLNFRAGGVPKKIMIPAGKTADISALSNLAQVLNLGDFARGFFEVVEEITLVEKPKKASTKKKTEDTLDKVEKEVKNYTDNKKDKK
jgi:Na+/phosphate symporter